MFITAVTAHFVTLTKSTIKIAAIILNTKILSRYFMLKKTMLYYFSLP